LAKLDFVHTLVRASGKYLYNFLSPKELKNYTHIALFFRNLLVQITLQSDSICQKKELFQISMEINSRNWEVAFGLPKLLFPKCLPFCKCVAFVKKNPKVSTTCQ
jgi:hypothetical protein